MVRFGSRLSCANVRFGALLALLLASGTFGLAGPVEVSAQGEAPSAEYESEISAAVDQHEAGHFEQARVHFLRAHEVFPNARTLRGLGKVEFELRNYVAALHYLEDALASPVRPLPQDLRDEVTALLERARAQVAEVSLRVMPESATLIVDGNTFGTGPSARLCLPEGDHVLELSAPGRVSERRTLSLHAGERSELAIQLAPLQVSAPPTTAQDRSERRDAPTPAYRKWWVWTVTGVTVAAVASAAAVLAARDHDVHTRAAPAGASFSFDNP
jgi:tetratricopeptide (TPR) repeat protein